MESNANVAPRTTKSVLAGPEKWILVRIAARLPAWVTPDQLSALALLAAAWITTAYLLSNRSPAWLWGASAGLVVHWFGDSLDGTLARVRHIERPRYGFYVDHLADALSTAAIGLGLGLSPYMLLSVGFALVIAYLILSLNVYLETLVLQQFRLGYGIMGPTEVRILLILLNTLAALGRAFQIRVMNLDATILDVIGILAAGGMTAMLLRRIIRNLRILGRLEPAGVVRKPDPPVK